MVAPLAVKVVVCPEQIVGLLTAIVIPEPIVKEAVACVVHELFAPVTVIIVDEAGANVKVEPITLPGSQVYVVAPVPVNVAVWPAQIVWDAKLMVGVTTTLTVEIAVFEHKLSVPVTE